VTTATRARQTAWATLLAGLLACSKPATEAPAPDAPSEVPSPSSSALSPSPAGSGSPSDADVAPVATMKLLEPGASPRRKLRYTWRTRQAETLTMDLRTAASTEEGSTKQPEIVLPPVRILVAIDPRDVLPDGDLSYAWHVTSAEVTTDAQTPPSLAQGMSAEVAAVERLSGTGAVTSRGLSARVSLDAVPGMGPGSTGQMVEQVRQTLRDVAAPFPEEEVGVGARWEKLSQLALRDARVTQTETFRLVSVVGDTGSLADLSEQTAPPQPLLSPGAAPGAVPARIESMLSSGDGTTRFVLTRLVPETKFEGTTTMVVSSHPRSQAAGEPAGGPAGNEARRMTMIMRVGIVLAGNLR
jgi:hypothetical protein